MCYHTYRYDPDAPLCFLVDYTQVEQPFSVLLTPECQAMSFIQRWSNWLKALDVVGDLPVPNTGGYCIWPPPDFNTLYIQGTYPGDILDWEWGSSPYGPKQIWFC